MKRKITDNLIAWKNEKGRKPLVVTGARQCGKTYAIKEFGREHFENLAYFNFEGNAALQSIFDYDFNIERIVTELERYSKQKISDGRTLVFFDEVQACPKAITSLKYFCEDRPGLHLIAAGSLLGVVIRQAEISFPVGKVEILQMYPLPELYTIPLQNYLKLYYIVGGMPAAVDSFVQENDFDKVDRILDNILLDYSNDFSKHATASDIPKLSWIWDSVPKQLAKDKNKFMFSHVNEGKRAADLEDALQWLFSAGLLHKLECVTNAELPLSNNANATIFKVYMSDVGLLRVKSGIDAKTILEDTALYAGFKGPFTENFVMNELVKKGLHPYFWKSQNTAELAFIFEVRNELFPVEVKADLHTKAKSYNVFCKKYSPKKGFVLSQKNIAITTNEHTETRHLPLYLCSKII